MRESERSPRGSAALALVVLLAGAGAAPAQGDPQAASPAPAAQAPAFEFERVGFQQAVARALERHPSVGEAEQAIRRSQALLDEARSVFRPTLYGNAGATMLDDARGFNGFTTQPRTQTVWSATAAYPVLDTARWKGTSQAKDRLGIARISAEETRLRVAVAAAQAYLAVVAAERQREIALRNSRPVAPSTTTHAPGSRPAAAAASTTCARRRSARRPRSSSRWRSCSCAGPRRRSGSRSSPTPPWTPTATRSFGPPPRRRTMPG
jgi:hypothetical protein